MQISLSIQAENHVADTVHFQVGKVFPGIGIFLSGCLEMVLLQPPAIGVGRNNNIIAARAYLPGQFQPAVPIARDFAADKIKTPDAHLEKGFGGLGQQFRFGFCETRDAGVVAVGAVKIAQGREFKDDFGEMLEGIALMAMQRLVFAGRVIHQFNQALGQ